MSTSAELTARLVKINAAIDYVLDGNAQSLAIAGRALTTLSLDELEKMKDKYEMQLANVNGVRPSVIRFQRPS